MHLPWFKQWLGGHAAGRSFVAQSGLSKATLPWQELAQALLLSNEFMFVD